MVVLVIPIGLVLVIIFVLYLLHRCARGRTCCPHRSRACNHLRTLPLLHRCCACNDLRTSWSHACSRGHTCHPRRSRACSPACSRPCSTCHPHRTCHRGCTNR